jgi:hypothetical protein
MNTLLSRWSVNEMLLMKGMAFASSGPVTCLSVFVSLNGCVAFASSVPSDDVFCLVHIRHVVGIIMISLSNN